MYGADTVGVNGGRVEDEGVNGGRVENESAGTKLSWRHDC
jgi:hypothetical protein